MAPSASTQTLLSPAELSFIHSSLSLNPPIRPDLRTPTQFRPLVAETDILASTNGSARICYSDGTEAIVGVKAEVERTGLNTPRAAPAGVGSAKNRARAGNNERTEHIDRSSGSESESGIDAPTEIQPSRRPRAATTVAVGPVSPTNLEVSIEIPGYRDDDPLPVFLSSMITETLLAEGTLNDKLYLNSRWHWKLYIDILLLSPPLSYPLPLLSLTTHLALLDARLPRLTSEKEDDPMFYDDWDAALPLYPRAVSPNSFPARPPVTLLIMTVGQNIIFDPSREELAVAESVLAVSVASNVNSSASAGDTGAGAGYRLLAIRTIDPPSRLTPQGVPDALNFTALGASGSAPSALTVGQVGSDATSKTVAGRPSSAAHDVLVEKQKGNLWSPPRGGVKRGLIARVIKMVVGKGGVAGEVLEGLAGVET